MKPQISVEAMMEAGMHFGHQTFRHNPKMDQYIFGVKSGIHIIDLTKTEPLLEAALEFISQMVAEGKSVILVGTKRQAASIVKEQAERARMPYVQNRWLGGILTNFDTVSKRLAHLRQLDERFKKNDFVGVTKKEKVLLDREYKSLISSVGGLQELRTLPGAIFAVDMLKDAIAVREAHKLGIPVVAIVDTNANPDLADYPIPANDDARKAIEYVVKLVADACLAKPRGAARVARESAEAEIPATPATDEVAIEDPKVKIGEEEGV
ncbi:MAG: 30S ribosomal protein S2 [bacterium]